MRSYSNIKDISTQIKAGLQLCNQGINNGKYPEQEYRLFCSLAELYLFKKHVKEYPKVVAIYQYLEYAIFLLMYHDPRNKEEYSFILGIIMSAIVLKDNRSGLSYGQVEKATVAIPIQELLKRQSEVHIKPYLLVYYLLVKIHCMHTNKEQAEEALKEFKEEVEKLKDSNDRLLAQYLLNWCHTEIESLKIQQVVTPQLTSVINASELAMAEKREVTTAFLLRTLSNNHIGVIWDCYIGREHRIVCELKVLFITILAKPEKTLRLTLEQRSGMHINLIMEYADDVHLEKIANDNKMKIEMIEEDISTIRH